MSYTGNYYNYNIKFGPGLTPVIKNLIIINSIVFLIQTLVTVFKGPDFTGYFSLHTYSMSFFSIYQFLTYAFLHGGILHILLNMLFLYMFGAELENLWGKNRFLAFYLFTCVFAGIFTWVVHNTIMDPIPPVVGASGGIYGLLIAYALVWPNREVLFMLFFPMKIKYMVMIMMLILAFSLSEDSRISHITHLGGAIGGFLFYQLLNKYKYRKNFSWSLRDYLHRRKMMRLQKEMHLQINAKDRVDELLDKISKHGIDSLSRKERQFLKEASDKYYND
ncbi:MAG: rhomboid family intramembrane serine protease [Leptospiraceae bacterium]|nr:rhomboid family intramembrane serine protease [Leptospiraceae bacterium]MCP5497506.1 rhomboid family intramembrane serine protease [Leptospiraceae bacterium]